MKKFIDICKLTQRGLKKYLKDYLMSCGYTVISGGGFLYAKGSLPVLLTAHMDTVHKENIKEINIVKVMNGDRVLTKYSSPQGIGGDDRCGIWMIMNIIRTHKCSVLFCEDEEIGCVGSRKFSESKYVKDLGVNYMIELDRHGSKDAVFYSCDNKDFTKWIEENTGYKKAIGSCSDISKIMPASTIAGVNFSCGYYNEHTKNEYVYYEEMEDTMNMVIGLLEKESPRFGYVEKKYDFSSSFGGYNYKGYYGYNNYDDYYDNYSGKNYYGKTTSKKSNFNNLVSDTQVKLVVEIDEEMGGGKITTYGNTKPECWMNFFFENSDVCFEFVTDYYYE